jgi:hypothetical protein
MASNRTGTMSERVVGPLGHVMREFAAGNPGTQYLIGEVLEAHKRLREYDGMMTRREVLEKVTQTSRALCMANSTSQVWWNGYLTGLSISAHIRGQLPEQVRDAAHELALLMNAEREEAQENE